MVVALPFAEDVRVNRENGTGIVAQVLCDLVNGGAEAQPGRGGVVPERVAAEAERELAYDADRELPALLVGEQMVIRGLARRVMPEDRQGSRRERDAAGAAPRSWGLLLVAVGV